MSRERAINLIQDKCRQINGIEYAPELRDYQSALAQFALPIAMTEITGGSLSQGNRTHEARTRVFVGAIGQGLNDVGDPIAERARLMDNFTAEFDADSDSTNYLNSSQYGYPYVLEADASTTTLRISDPFVFTLPGANNRGVVEYPLGSGQWYWVFDVAFQIIEEPC